MKEFIYSVLFYLGSSVRNGFAHSLSLPLRVYSRVVCCQQKRHIDPPALVSDLVSDLVSKSTDSSSSRPHSSCQLNVVGISFFLREPIRATIRILTKNRLFIKQIETFRNTSLSPAAAAKIGQGIQIHQDRELRELLNLDKRSRIVASFHFGNFVYGLHKVLCLQADTRNTLVLSQSKSTRSYMDNMASAFGEKSVCLENQVLLEKTDVCGLSGFLREPNRCLLMFADLPNSFGQTTEIEFLGRKANFSKSIALLSLTNNVPVLPVICFEDGDGHQIEIGQQIEPLTREEETRAGAVTRLTQLQLDFFQHFFIRHKEQWRYLNHLPEYFTEGST
jgi:lauroyl/myristoyl acyltransferase